MRTMQQIDENSWKCSSAHWIIEIWQIWHLPTKLRLTDIDMYFSLETGGLVLNVKIYRELKGKKVVTPLWDQNWFFIKCSKYLYNMLSHNFGLMVRYSHIRFFRCSSGELSFIKIPTKQNLIAIQYLELIKSSRENI